LYQSRIDRDLIRTPTAHDVHGWMFSFQVIKRG
jgi:hypothetical protein